jgi:hypothetical protein
MRQSIIASFLLPIILFSGCSSNTGQVVETTKMTTLEPAQSQQQEMEDIRKEFKEFEKSQADNATDANHSQEDFQKTKEEPESQKEPQPAQEPAAEAQPSAEPEQACPACSDNDPCTQDICSGETSYECIYENIIPCCGNGECENGENPERCLLDCQKTCDIQCNPCETLETEACSCLPNACVSGDSCCPQGCNYTEDSDCPLPDACSSDQGCSDSNPCTIDTCSGSPRKCHYSQAGCLGGDGCCLESCRYIDDSDCPKPSPSVVFSEIYYNAPGTDTGHEWIEVYNNGTVAVDLTKWRFVDNEKQHFLKNTTEEGTIDPEEYAVIADDSDIFLADYPDYIGLLFDSSFYSGLSNSAEALVLLAGKDGEISDSVTYNSSWGGDGNGFSLEKIDLSGPNTQENWNQSVSEKGTPGAKNSISI